MKIVPRLAFTALRFVLALTALIPIAVEAAPPAPPAEPAPAPKPAPTPVPPMGEWMSRLKFEGRAYFRYSYEMADAANDFNEFNIDRAYLTLHAKIAEKASLKYTLEGGDLRENGTDQFDVSTKHLFLDLQNVLGKDTFVRFGLADLPWVPYEEALWGYRFQGTIFADRSGYLTSTDLGVGVGGKFQKGYGSWHASLANGEGWRKRETGKYKDFHARVQLNPFAASAGPARDFFVSAFFLAGQYDGVTTGPDDRQRFILYSAFKRTDRFLIAGQYLRAKDPAERLVGRHPSLAERAGEESSAKGSSIYGVLNLSALGGGESAKKWEVIARWDHLDPDDEIADNNLDRVIAGISYRWIKAVQSLLDYETVNYGDQAVKNDEKRILFQTEVRF